MALIKVTLCHLRAGYTCLSCVRGADKLRASYSSEEPRLISLVCWVAPPAARVSFSLHIHVYQHLIFPSMSVILTQEQLLSFPPLPIESQPQPYLEKQERVCVLPRPISKEQVCHFKVGCLENTEQNTTELAAFLPCRRHACSAVRHGCLPSTSPMYTQKGTCPHP